MACSLHTIHYVCMSVPMWSYTLHALADRTPSGYAGLVFHLVYRASYCVTIPVWIVHAASTPQATLSMQRVACKHIHCVEIEKEWENTTYSRHHIQPLPTPVFVFVLLYIITTAYAAHEYNYVHGQWAMGRYCMYIQDVELYTVFTYMYNASCYKHTKVITVHGIGSQYDNPYD